MDKKKTEIYLDMDGVLADFFSEYAKMAGVPDGTYRDIPPAKVDPTLDKMIGTDFFSRLPMFPNVPQLLKLVLSYTDHYSICSSPLRGDGSNSEKHKRIWIAKHLNPLPKDIIITGNKPKWATQPDGTPNILIDDRGQNIRGWIAAGGYGIKYQADEDSLETVKMGLDRFFKGDVEEESWLESYEQELNKIISENFADGKVNYTMPKLYKEWDEASRYPEFRKIGKDAWIKLASKGKAVTITSAKGISNTDATEPDSFSSLDKEKQARTLAQLKSNRVEMPIVAVYSDGHKELIGGNTRLTALMAQKGKATVWQFDVPDDVAELAENFADGKNPGRKGLSKRVGIPKNATLGQLEKIAKSSSGERRRMAQWQLNMRKGKKK